MRPPLTGRAEGGRHLRGDRPELRRQLRSPRPAHTHRRALASPRSKVRLNFDALSLPPLCRSSAAAAKQAAADTQAQPRGPTRQSAATATVAKERASGRWRRPGERLARSAPLGTARGCRPRRAPDLCRLNESSRLQLIGPRREGACVPGSGCGRQRAGSRRCAARVARPRGDRAFLIYVPASARLLPPKTSGRVSELPSPSVRTKGWMSEQHAYPLNCKLFFFKPKEYRWLLPTAREGSLGLLRCSRIRIYKRAR